MLNIDVEAMPTASIAMICVKLGKIIIGECETVIVEKQCANIVRIFETLDANTFVMCSVIATDGSGIRTADDTIVRTRRGITGTGISIAGTNLVALLRSQPDSSRVRLFYFTIRL